MIDEVSRMYNDQHQWRKTILGHTFTVSRSWTENGGSVPRNSVNMFVNWLREHEEAQVMLASILVVIGIWWVVRTLLSLFMNLVFPLLLVFLAVICVPQLRASLLGQNYPALADMLRNVLLKLAENLK